MAHIFFTSPTSGTASMQRILGTIAKGYKINRLGKPAADQPAEDKVFLDPTAEKTIYWFQGPRNWNPGIALDPFKLVVHYRDPRDLACNQYWWALQHPNDRDPPEVAAQKRKAVETRGIDNYATTKNLSGLFDIFLDFGERSDAAGATFTSYAQLCTAFDYMVDNLCRAFDRPMREVMDALRGERPENLAGNADWVKVGGTWQGSDISPGRFRKELTEESCAKLVTKYTRELAFCRDHDAPFLAEHYS